MSSHRHERVRELLKREIGEAIRREVPVEEAGLVSVNDLQMSGDLKLATVYISILGGLEQQRKGMKLLHKARPLIQEHVAKAVILKFTPHLRFHMDDTITRGDKILKILEDIEKASPNQ